MFGPNINGISPPPCNCGFTIYSMKYNLAFLVVRISLCPDFFCLGKGLAFRSEKKGKEKKQSETRRRSNPELFGNDICGHKNQTYYQAISDDWSEFVNFTHFIHG